MPKTSEMKSVLRHVLMQDPDVHKIVDGRVFSAHGRESEAATREHPTVIFEGRGGRNLPQAAAGVRTTWILAYSNRSLDEALQLYEAVSEVLDRKGQKGRLDDQGDPCEDVCIYGIEQAGTFDGYNGDVCAWFVRGVWTIWGIG